MSSVAISQLLWAIYGAVLGACAALAWAGYRGWFNRKTEVQAVASLNVESFIDAIAPAMAQGVAAMRPQHTIIVDWSIIHAVIEREGYMLVAKPKDADTVVRTQ